MKNKFTLPKRLTLESILLGVIFVFSFVYIVSKPAVFSPDSYSYLRADMYRFPGYVAFLRISKFIFGEQIYPYFVITFQAIFALLSVYFLYKKVSGFWEMNPVFKTVLLGVLLLPFFSSLNIANEVSAEAISYGLYLISINFTIDFLFKNRYKTVFYIAIVTFLLSLTRGQFILIPWIIAFLFMLKERKQLFIKKNIIALLMLLVLPFITKFADRTYRKIFFNQFVETPYSFVNSVTLPLFIASEKDTLQLTNPDTKHIFKHSLRTIDSLRLRSVYAKTNNQQYKLFHDNFPKICNQNIHDYGRHYFYQPEAPHQSTVEIEKTSKELFFVLVSNHFTQWMTLYFEGMKYGFKSVFILIFVLVMMLISGWKTLMRFDSLWAMVFLGTLYLLSNSMIVALACHSIDRYLFYNWFFMVVIIYAIFQRSKTML